MVSAKCAILISILMIISAITVSSTILALTEGVVAQKLPQALSGSTVADFNVTASNVTMNVGDQSPTIITVIPLNGFNGTVSLTYKSLDNLICDAKPLPNSLTFNGTSSSPQTSKLSCSSTTAGNYDLKVTATSSRLVHFAIAKFTIQDFQVYVSPSTVSANIDSTFPLTISIAPVSGFTSKVTLTQQSPFNLSCGNPNPSSITGSGTATVTCTPSSSGNYYITIIGTTGSISHSATIPVTVPEPDFNLVASPTTVTVTTGTTGTSSIALESLYGFSSQANLSTDNPSACSISPSTISASSSSTLSCAFGNAQSTAVTVTGTTPTLSHAVIVSFIVQDFTISASPPSPVNLGSSAMSTVSITGQNGFTGTISLVWNEPTNSVTCGFSSNPITIGQSSPVSVTMSCTSKTAGTFTVTISANSGQSLHQSVVTMTFGDFAILPNPSIVKVTAGNVAMSTLTLTSNGYNGQIDLQVTQPNIPGFVADVNPSMVSLVPGESSFSILTVSTQASTPASTYSLIITCSNCISGTHDTTVTVNIAGNLTLSTNNLQVRTVPGTVHSITVLATSYGVAGPLELSTSSTTPLIIMTDVPPVQNLTPGVTTPIQIQLTISPQTLAGNYTLGVSGNIGGVQKTLDLVVTVGDFVLSINPNPISVVAGSTSSTTLTVQGIYDFNGTVSLSVQSLNGMTLALDENNVTLTLANDTANVGLTITVPAYIVPKTYTFTITGILGQVQHSSILQLSVVEFSVIAPASVDLLIGQSQSANITITSRNGFTGHIALVTSIRPKDGLSISISNSTIFLQPNATATSILTLTANRSDVYLLTINATSGPNVSYQYVLVNVGDFTISVTPVSLNVARDGSRTLTVNLLSVNNFQGTIVLTARSSPLGPGLSFSPVSPILSKKSTTSVTLTITGGQVQPGTYNVTITGASGGLIHEKSILVTLTIPPVLIVPNNQSIDPGRLVSFYVNLTDPDPNVKLFATQLPQGANFITSYHTSLDLTTVIGLFSWKPSSTQTPGDYVIVFTAQDHNGGVITRQVTVHVNGPVNRSISLPSPLWLGYGLIAIGGIIVTLAGGRAWRRSKKNGNIMHEHGSEWTLA